MKTMINIPAFLLVVMFGSSTWLTVNTIWVELSLYTSRLPEGWSLPSYLSLIIQLACLVTLVYSIGHRYTRFNSKKAPFILSLLIFGSICMILLALFWDKTLWLFGTEHSIALIVFTFCIALVCASSNLLFMPYMAAFHSSYMSAYFLGMSFSSLLPSILKLIQGVGQYNCIEQHGVSKLIAVPTEPLFSIMVFNSFIFVWMCMATFSFAILHWKFEHAKESADIEHANGSCPPGGRTSVCVETDRQVEDVDVTEQSPLKIVVEKKSALLQDGSPPLPMSKVRYWALVSMLALISAEMNAIVPSVQSYATHAYSLLTYHLALTLSNISHPPANFLPMWFKPRSLSFIFSLTLICSAGVVLIFVLALQSPDPLFRDSFPLIGSGISIGASVITGFLCSYLRTLITGLVRNEQYVSSEAALFWCGFFMQVGSLLGAFAMFPLVNYLSIFKKRDPCSN